HPPQGIDDLLSAVRTLPLPDVQLPSNLPATFSSLGSVIPSDPGSVTGDLTARLHDLGGSVADGLVKELDAALKTIVDLSKLLQVDLSCLHDTPAGGGAGGAAGGGGAGAGGGGGGG